MKKSLYCLFFLLLSSLSLLAFQDSADSSQLQRVDELGLAGIQNRRMGNYELALSQYDSALAILTNKFPEKLVEKEDIIYNKGHVYLDKGEHQKSLDCFLDGLKLLNSIPNYPDTLKVWTIQAVGVVYRVSGEYTKAEQYLENAYAIRRAAYGESHPYVAATAMVLGRLKKEMGQLEAAMELLNKALSIRLKKESSPQHIAATYSTIGLTLGNMQKYSAAIDSLQKALEIKRQLYELDHPSIGQSFNSIGLMHLHAGNYSIASRYFKQALDIRLKRLGKKNIYTSVTYANISQLRFKQGNFNSAIQAIDHAVQALNYSSIDNLDEVFSIFALVKCFNYKAYYYRKRYEYTLEANALIHADSLYDLSLQTLQHFQKTMRMSETNLEWIDKVYEVAEGAILTGQFSFKETGDKPFTGDEVSFMLSEQSKSSLLRQSYSELSAKQYYDIPDAISAKETALKTAITQGRKIIYEELSKSIYDTNLVYTIRNKIFKLNNEYDHFITTLEEKHPKYHQLKYDNKVVGIKTVQQKLLLPDQALVEYFIGDSILVIYLIQPQNHQVFHIQKPRNLDQLIFKMREGMLQAILGEEAHYKQYNQQYVDAAYALYQLLVSPFDSLLAPNTELIIIPDNNLGLIPYEVLLKSLPTNSTDFRNHSYLLKTHPISYAYSATQLLETKTSKHQEEPDENLLVVAPFLSNDTKHALKEGATPLFYDEAEVKAIDAVVPAHILRKEAATKTAFIKASSRYRMLHLSSHGQANAQDGEFSFIAFHHPNSSLEIEKLYVSDLYNMQLNADLVVLSACETGFGEWQRGEGVISLAQGFSYSGAKSILSSLWKVEDYSTSLLMSNFYKNLSMGMSKSKALKKAKLDFLNKTNNVEPFFWAAFIPIGDMAPLVLKQKKRSKPYLIASILAIAIIGFLLKRMSIF